MTWFTIALIGPILWAVVNHIDKYLLTNHFQGTGVGVLMLFSTLTAGGVLPGLYLADSSAAAVAPHHIALLLMVGVMSGAAVWLYLLALEIEEASVVVPLFQTTPIFGLLFAYLFLGEVLTPRQLTGSLLVLAGSVVITLELGQRHPPRFKQRVLWLMLGSSALFGLFETLFKLAAVNYTIWASVFWEHVGLFILGLLLLTSRHYRESLIRVLRRHQGTTLGLNVGSELLTIGGNVATSYALLLAPVALVLVVTGFQPLLVFAIGTALSIYLPKLASERVKRADLLHKISAILVILSGAVLINL